MTDDQARLLRLLERSRDTLLDETRSYYKNGDRAPDVLFDAYQNAHAAVINMRGEIVGTGYWTEDGGPVVARWEQLASPHPPVYYERFEDGQRVSHGWIDPRTRRIVQTG